MTKDPESLKQLGLKMAKNGKYHDAEEFLWLYLHQRSHDTEARTWLAMVIGMQGRDKEALKIFQEIIDKEPLFFEAWASLGDKYRAMKNFQEAERCYKQVLVIKPEYLIYRFRLASVQRDQGLLDEAITTCREQLAIGENSEIRFYIGKYLYEQKKWAEAERELRLSLRIMPDFLLSQDYLIQSMKQQSKYSQAVEFLRETVFSSSHPGILWIWIAELQQFYLQNPDMAMIAATRAIENGEVSQGFLIKAELEFAQGNAFDALDSSIRSMESSPSISSALLNAEICLALGYFQKAGEMMEEAATFIDQISSPSRILQAKFFSAKGAYETSKWRFRDAETLFQKAAQLDEENLEIRLRLAIGKAHIGNYEEAMKICQKAVTDFPENPSPLYVLSICRKWEGNLDESDRIRDILLLQHPSVELKWRWTEMGTIPEDFIDFDDLLRGARVLTVNGKNQIARKLLKDRLKDHPLNPQGWVEFGYAQSGLSRMRKYFTRALEIDSQNFDAWYLLARSMLNKKEKKQLVHFCLDHSAHFYHRAEFWEMLGDALLLENDLPEALQAFRHALKLDPHYYGPNVKIATILQQQKLFAASEDVRNRMISKFPEDSEAWDILRKIHIETELPEQECDIEDIQNAFDLKEPKSKEIQANLSN